jgi:hypothetical protein
MANRRLALNHRAWRPHKVVAGTLKHIRIGDTIKMDIHGLTKLPMGSARSGGAEDKGVDIDVSEVTGLQDLGGVHQPVRTEDQAAVRFGMHVLLWLALFLCRVRAAAKLGFRVLLGACRRARIRRRKRMGRLLLPILVRKMTVKTAGDE